MEQNLLLFQETLDNQAKPLELYKKCGFEGDDVWYICQVDSNEQHEKVVSVTQGSARDMKSAADEGFILLSKEL